MINNEIKKVSAVNKTNKNKKNSFKKNSGKKSVFKELFTNPVEG